MRQTAQYKYSTPSSGVGRITSQWGSASSNAIICKVMIPRYACPTVSDIRSLAHMYRRPEPWYDRQIKSRIFLRLRRRRINKIRNKKEQLLFWFSVAFIRFWL